MLSGRAGPFEWPAKSEQAEAYARLMAAAGDIHVVRVPFVAGRALQVCTDAGLDPATAMMTEFAPARGAARRLRFSRERLRK